MVVRAGLLATRYRKPGQARKGAAVVVAVCAGVRLAGTASQSFNPPFASVKLCPQRTRTSCKFKAIHVLSGAGPQVAPQVL
jgi:hypothetical protein